MGKNAYRLLVGEPDGRRQLRRKKHEWVDNIEMDLEETGLGGMDWIGLVQNWDRLRALVNEVMNLWVP
jgi:hypothetical protein